MQVVNLFGVLASYEPMALSTQNYNYSEIYLQTPDGTVHGKAMYDCCKMLFKIIEEQGDDQPLLAFADVWFDTKTNEMVSCKQ
jgi:hypothetical protein